jgi:hypothetical protein
MMSPIKFPLAEMFTSAGSAATASAADDDDDVGYSIQPLPYMTVVGEHLLLLVQLFAPLARGDVCRSSPVGVDVLQSRVCRAMLPRCMCACVCGRGTSLSAADRCRSSTRRSS